MPTRSLEIIIGALVLVLGFVGLVFGISRSGVQSAGYKLYASFTDATGIFAGTLVEIAGVPVGQVTDVRLSDNYDAQITIHINENIEIPEDSELAWRQSDLIGAPRLSILVFDVTSEILQPNDYFSSTDPADNFFDVLSDLAAGGQ
ncbi:MAG: MlaD family protein [Alphaproteobacteria bacterium]